MLSGTNESYVSFQVTGGTSYSGLNTTGLLYDISSIPTSTTFTIKAYSGGRPTGADVDAGSAGTGTMTVGISNAGMIFATNRWMGFGEANAALYDGQRGSLLPLKVKQYEGNPEPLGPTAAQCTTLGVTGTDCEGSIKTAIQSWYADTKARDTMIAYFKWFMGTDLAFTPSLTWTHSNGPSHLIPFYQSCTPGTLPTANLPWVSLTIGCLPSSGLSQAGQGYRDFNLN